MPEEVVAKVVPGKAGIDSAPAGVRAGCVGRVLVKLAVEGRMVVALEVGVGGVVHLVSRRRESIRLGVRSVGAEVGRCVDGRLWGWRRRMRIILEGCRRWIVGGGCRGLRVVVVLRCLMLFVREGRLLGVAVGMEGVGWRR